MGKKALIIQSLLYIIFKVFTVLFTPKTKRYFPGFLSQYKQKNQCRKSISVLSLNPFEMAALKVFSVLPRIFNLLFLTILNLVSNFVQLFLGYGISKSGKDEEENVKQRSPISRPLSVNYHFLRTCNYSCGFCFHTAKTSFVLPIEKVCTSSLSIKSNFFILELRHTLEEPNGIPMCHKTLMDVP